MGLNHNKIAVSFIAFLAIIVAAQSRVFDVTKLGAKPNSDVTSVLDKAWKDACAETSASKVLIPKGTYKLTKAMFKGPCKAPIEVQLIGTLQAPNTASGFKSGDGWVTFDSVDRLTVDGGGVFDGNGKGSWGHCGNQYCDKLPINLRFNYVTNSVFKSVTSLDSKQFHILVYFGHDLTFRNLRIIAPEESINTDGIHVGHATNVNITDSYIATGDDCVSVGDGVTKLTATKITCDHGHGISVGSLGLYPNEKPVEGVIVRNCTFVNTPQGVRIKSWPGAYSGTASDLHFEQLIMKNVGIPVLIDQEYCPGNKCKKNVPSNVKISKVSFKNIVGTSTTPVPVRLKCSASHPCEDVEFGGMDIKYYGKLPYFRSLCRNVVKLKVSGYMNPKACMSTKSFGL